MKNSELVFTRLMKRAPQTIDLFTFAKGSGMYNPNYDRDMKRHSLKVAHFLSWSVSKCEKLHEIRPELASLGERHRNYGLDLSYILPMEAVIMELARGYLGEMFSEEIREAWSLFLKILLYSIFHPLLKQDKRMMRQQIFLVNCEGRVLAVTNKRMLVFWIVVISLLVGWFKVNFGERAVY